MVAKPLMIASFVKAFTTLASEWSIIDTMSLKHGILWPKIPLHNNALDSTQSHIAHWPTIKYPMGPHTVYVVYFGGDIIW